MDKLSYRGCCGNYFVCDIEFIIEPFFFPNCFIIAISLIVLQPAIMRWGRAIWIGITVKYDPNLKKSNSSIIKK
ncbi:MAG: hypothetical protein IPG89_11095 [Bacteroidetes bacterium]|nr:hypothetical protein [Bacteroidota bacterium]